jgi:hypothetical protein
MAFDENNLGKKINELSSKKIIINMKYQISMLKILEGL